MMKLQPQFFLRISSHPTRTLSLLWQTRRLRQLNKHTIYWWYIFCSHVSEHCTKSQAFKVLTSQPFRSKIYGWRVKQTLSPTRDHLLIRPCTTHIKLLIHKKEISFDWSDVIANFLKMVVWKFKQSRAIQFLVNTLLVVNYVWRLCFQEGAQDY